jgi:arylsulfatase A-like enzyme
MWHISDLLPTIVQGIAGVDVSKEGLDGVNQWPSMISGGPSPRSEILHNIDPILQRAAIRSGDMKLLLGPVGENDWFIPAGWTPPSSQHPPVPGPEPNASFVGLFNITEDPREFNNLAASMPDMVKQLRARLDAYNATAVPCRYPDDDPNSDPSKLGGAWGPWM